MNPETILQNSIRLALGSAPDLTLYRNTTGQAEHTSATGQRYRQRFGLTVGGSDLIGILAVDMQTVPWHTRAGYGCASRGCEPSCRPSQRIRVGRFVALEVKLPRPRGKDPTPAQLQFLALIRSRGGFACVVRSVAEAEAAIERARAGASE